MKKQNALIISSALFGLLAIPAHAATIANWKVLVGANSPAISGANTDSPVFGGVSPVNQMDAAQTAGRFGTVATPASVTLAVGETLTVSFNVTLTGGLDVLNHYRFGVFDDGGQFAASSESNWAGGWLHSTGNGLYQGNTGGSFASNSGTTPNNAALLSNTDLSAAGAIAGDSAATYLWTMAITRGSATSVDLSASFVGGDGAYSNSYAQNGQATSLFTYTAVGILTSGATDLDQLSISNAQYSVVPEPSSALLGGLGVLLLLRRRRA